MNDYGTMDSKIAEIIKTLPIINKNPDIKDVKKIQKSYL